MELPRAWVAVRQAVAELANDHINVQRYVDLCAKEGMDPALALVVSRVFHELGAFLHFQDEIELQDRIFLNHEWVTDAVYRVLDNKAIIDGGGRFGQADLRRIWSEPRYATMQQKLLALMCKFELCYSLDRHTYLAPQLLHGDRPPEIPWQSSERTLHFVYQYDFMPRGILSRLMVRLHENIYNEVQWYSGMMLAWGGAKALVQEDRGQRRITIAAEGGDSRGLITWVRNDIAHIHRSFGPDLQVHKQIPCNCANCVQAEEPYFHAYSYLQSLLKSGIYEVRCHRAPHDEVNINRLIAAVIEPEHERRRRDLEDLDLGRDGAVQIHNVYNIDSGGGAVIKADQLGIGGNLVGRDSIE